jgi:hypothetical protein
MLQIFVRIFRTLDLIQSYALPAEETKAILLTDINLKS